MILGSNSLKPYSEMDVLILQAYQILEEERCSQCGLPRYLCQNSDPKLNVRIKEYKCIIKAQIEEEDESRKENAKGTVLYPEMYHLDDVPLHKMRDSYREQQEQEAAEGTD